MARQRSGQPVLHGRRRGRRARGALIALAALAAIGCGALDNGPTSAEGNGGGGGTGGNFQSPVVGQWSREISFYDAQNDLNTSRTIWNFASDSSAWRAVIATNVFTGFSDTTLDNLRFYTTGSTLYFRFVTDTSWLQMSFALRGDSLYLGGQGFVRVAP